MELWVRSQDKNRLTRVDDLYIVHDDNNFCDYIGNDMVGNLAKYTKQGRALEVLDEIQKILEPQEYYIKTERGTFTKTTNVSIYVYEMPEE